jgi:hypothetical protein
MPNPQSQKDNPAADATVPPSGSPSIQRLELSGDGSAMLSISRKVVYCQAALLGLAAIGFFSFGVFVGYFSADRRPNEQTAFECRLSGSVICRSDGDLTADTGAVVCVLPRHKRPLKTMPGGLVNPDSFRDLDNAAVDAIGELGGAVGKVDENGSFDVLIDAKYGAGINYYVLVVSKDKRGVDTKQITPRQVEVIGAFFDPIEDLIEDRSYFWTEINAYEKEFELVDVEFD